MRKALACAALHATACAGSGPTEAPDSPDEPDAPAVATLEIVGPSSLIVPQTAPFAVTTRDSVGGELLLPQS